MLRTSPNLESDHISMNDMMSNVSKITDRDEVTMRKFALKRIMSRFPLDSLRATILHLNEEEENNNPKRRQSFQEPKNKFNQNSEGIERCKKNLYYRLVDDRETESLPDLDKEFKNMLMDKSNAK